MDRGTKRPKRLLLVLLAALLGGCATPLPFHLFASSTLPDRHEQAEPPPGFADFCVRFADQCTKRPEPPAVVTLDEATWQRLKNVNHAVNAAITPEDDEAHYGREEFWTIPTDGFGDCEDFALTKRKNLLDAGFPDSAVRIAVVYSIKTALHAVLTVSTDKGDLVLDSLSDKILPWNATGYIWMEVQAPTNPMHWDSLQPAYAGAAPNPVTSPPTATGEASGPIPTFASHLRQSLLRMSESKDR